MARFSSIFGLSNTQAELDFVDIDTSTDTRLYIDPYAIQIREDEWSSSCGDHIRSFFAELLEALRGENLARAEHLVSHLHEPNETFLGQSKGRPRGRGVGTLKAQQLVTALRNSRAFETGVISDISEAELFIHGVGPDTISDLTTNVIRGRLAEYTMAQCQLHSVPTSVVRSLGPVWVPNRGDWESSPLNLPTSDAGPILLVPKFSVRRRLSLDSQEFWNHYMVEFLRQEYLDSRSALVQVLRDGTPYVTKKSVKQRHPFIKNDLADFVSAHPEILEQYKEIKGAGGTLDQKDFEEEFDEAAFATVLIDKLAEIAEGSEEASAYHQLLLGICTFIFYPGLITPIKEREIHEGRKRIDIKFTNTGESGFFRRMQESAQTRSLSVPVECKNYSNNMNNPELDQLTGRFGHTRGFFGMLFCRRLENRDRIIAGCRDAALDGRGYMLVFEDADVVHMLELIRDGSRTEIGLFLQQRFDEITH